MRDLRAVKERKDCVSELVAYLMFLPYTHYAKPTAAYLTMLLPDTVFVGVDTTSAHKAFTYAALDRSLRVAALAEGELEDVADFLAARQGALVAVNSPSRLNVGLVRQSAEKEVAGAHQLRGVDLRVAEHELRLRGILVSGTPSRESSCAAWIRLGLSLYRKLLELGFEGYPAAGCPQQVLETHPHAAFCALIGRTPLSKPSLEGRLQRQLALFERGVRVHDPMSFFEEITRHKLLNGILPSELIYQPEQLDALVAAYTAWLAGEKTAELTRLGADEEGYIYLPAANLKERYEYS